MLTTNFWMLVQKFFIYIFIYIIYWPIISWQYLCILFWLQCISAVQTFKSLPIKTARLQSLKPVGSQTFLDSVSSLSPLQTPPSLISCFILSLSPPDQNNRHVRKHQVCVSFSADMCVSSRPHKFICVFLCPLVQMLTQH